MKRGNIYSAVPQIWQREILEPLIDSCEVRIERIISHASCSPPGFWYDQEESEWVMVIEGGAGLKFEDETDVLVMKPGDWVEIPAHRRHRVEWTDSETQTVWLAVFYRRQ